MTYEQKDMTGVLFTNKKTKDTQPDFKGTIKVDGKEYEIAAWNKKSKAGNDFTSLVVSLPRPKGLTNQPIENTGLPF